MHVNCTRVQEALCKLGITVEIRELTQSTKSALEAAQAIGCRIEQIAKSMLFMSVDKPLLVILAGNTRIDTIKLSNIIGNQIRQPRADEVMEITGFPIGGVAPVGHLCSVSVYMDREISHQETVWAAAGTPHSVFSCNPKVLAAATGAIICNVKEEQ